MIVRGRVVGLNLYQQPWRLVAAVVKVKVTGVNGRRRHDRQRRVKLETLWKEYEYRRFTLRPPLPLAAEIGSISSGGEGEGCEGIRGHYR